MARPLRIQYPGAVYHVMARGSHGQPIFADHPDRKRFLETLEEACQKTGCIQAREAGKDETAATDTGRLETAGITMKCHSSRTDPFTFKTITTP